MYIRRLCLLFLFSFCIYAKLEAQTPNNKIKLFFEKIYLHTDRERYTSGEDIWFKSYLVNAQTHQLFSASNNLYVELIDPNSKLVERKTFRLDAGLGKGDFKLGDSIASGTYRLRAYTNWMRNFDDNFFFEKKISVVNVSGPNPGSAAIPVSDKLSFFPEGGSMIAGVSGVVGFKAEDGAGKGISLSGNIETEDGTIISPLNTSFNGMGRFLLQPETGKTYRARGKFNNGKSFNVTLPAALATGFSMYIKQNDSTFNVILKTNEATYSAMTTKQLAVLVKSKGKTIYSANMPLNEAHTSFLISKLDMPPGISSIVVYDDKGRPACERLVFVQGSEEPAFSMTSNKQSYLSKEKTTLSLKLTNAQNQPLKANLSLAAVDAGLIPEEVQGNIVSYLHLESELKGMIENPNQYFDKRNENRRSQLDLLLLCAGWRDFIWKRLSEENMALKYAIEQGISIEGKVSTKFSKEPLANYNITLSAFKAKDNKLFTTKTNEAGNFYIDGVNFQGAIPVKITSSNIKGERKGRVTIDTLRKYPEIKSLAVHVDTNAAVEKAALFTKFLERSKRKQSLSDTFQLKEIVIKGVRKPLVTKTMTLHDFGYKEENFKIKASDHSYANLQHFLTHRLDYNTAISDPKRLDGKAFSPPIVMINGREMPTGEDAEGKAEVDVQVLEMVYNLPMRLIKDVKVKRMVGPESKAVHVLFLTIDEDAFGGVEGTATEYVTGYYEVREFYKPNYQTPSKQTDLRTTIHWEPDISTNENGEATITYYNADPKTKIRVIAEGITDSGLPVRGSIEYTVK